MFRHKSGNTEGVRFSAPSKTAFHLKGMCNINNLIARVVKGDSTAIRPGGQFADISHFPDDLQSALNLTLAARENYSKLPHEVQSRYTSYEAFLGALTNPEEREFLTKNGVFKAPQVQVVNPPEIKE